MLYAFAEKLSTIYYDTAFFYSQCAHSHGRFCDTAFPPCEGCPGQKKILAAFSSVVCTGLDSLHPYRLFSRA